MKLLVVVAVVLLAVVTVVYADCASDIKDGCAKNNQTKCGVIKCFLNSSCSIPAAMQALRKPCSAGSTISFSFNVLIVLVVLQLADNIKNYF